MLPNQVELDIIRESGEHASWLNRYIRNAKTKEILYYCEVDEGSNLRIHRGDKSGPIIAEVNTCLVTPGGTDVHLADPLRTVELLHLPHGDTSQTRFSIDDKRYHWKGHSELLDDDTEVKMAQFYPSWHVIEVKEHKIGTLFIYGDTPRDLSVITALVVQERSDEARQAIETARIRSMEMGIADAK